LATGCNNVSISLVEHFREAVHSVLFVITQCQSISDIGTDVPVVVNKRGEKQSALDYRFDLIDPLPLFRLANIVANGVKNYGEWDWRRISLKDNLNPAITHAFAYLAGDRQDDHLGYAFTQLMFALSLEMTPGDSIRMAVIDG
jgi:hypothetical protein